MRDILLEIAVQFSYVHKSRNFIINFIKPLVVLFVMNEFERKKLKIWNAKTFSAIEFARVINETVSVLET